MNREDRTWQSRPTNVFQLARYLKVGCQVNRTYLSHEAKRHGIKGTHVATVSQVRHDGVVFKSNSAPKESTLELWPSNDIIFDDLGFRLVDHQSGISIVYYEYIN